MTHINTIDALKASDEVVFGELFRDYHFRVYSYILSKTNSSYIAEEATQLTFIKLWEHRNSLQEQLPLSGQIFRIAKTTCIDLLRKESVRVRHLAKQKSGVKVGDAMDVLHEKELQDKLNVAVKQMPPVRRLIFNLSRFEAKSHKEIAYMLSLSVRTVESHIHLALKQLTHLFFPLLALLFLF